MFMPSIASYGTIPRHLSNNRKPSPMRIYDNTIISGHAHVILGDVYSCQCLGLPGAGFLRRPFVGLAGATRALLNTERFRSNLNISPFLAVTTERIVRRYRQGTEVCRLMRIAVFGRFMLYFGISVEFSGDLRVYRPRLRGIVDDNACIMTACYEGDLMKVRQLLNDRLASVHDVTADDRSPLRRAIDGGQLSVVRLLLAYGADANQPMGEHRTSPLSWALYKRNEQMVRLLINAGADLQYISSRGWSVMYHLWIDEKTLQPSCLDLLRLLQTQDPDLMHFAGEPLVDDHGWSLLSRVACTGTADEVDFFIKSGADVTWKNEHGWDAMLDSVYGGKLDVLRLLSTHVPQWLSYQDARGYSALHVAAEEGHDQIIKFLLSMGADWQLRTYPVKCPRSDELLPGLTPADAARAECPHREQRFLQLIEEMEAGAAWAEAYDARIYELEAD